MFSIHGLIRSQNIEMGRDADTGGQIKYVLELIRNLASQPEVARVDLFTRMIRDKSISPDYAAEIEPVCEGARIVRIPCGGGRYIRKELLWPHLDEFVDKTLKFIKRQNLNPAIVHGHYADGGYVAMTLSSFFGIPFIFTGHSLGISKQQKLEEDGSSKEEIERKYNTRKRIQVEEDILSRADLVIASTKQEVVKQYGLYKNHSLPKHIVNPPGLDLERFYPYYEDELKDSQEELQKQAKITVLHELNRFFPGQDKPLILALSRPDKRKNAAALIQAYGEDKDIQVMANLAIFLGIRKNILDMEENERLVLTETLLLMDKYDLYGKMAIPKKHDFTYEVPELYRIAASNGGVFVNPALIEPFGLTLLEAAACGLPIVATQDGGPVDIIKNCNNGLLVDVSDPKNINNAIRKIIADEDLWKEYSMNGINNVRTHYSWKAHIKRYLLEIGELRAESAKNVATLEQESPVAQRLLKINKMLVTDIDNTLIGIPDALHEFLSLMAKHREQVGFGLATGRTIESTLEHLSKHGIPEPDLLITSVGSEIYYAGEKIRDSGWTAHIQQKWDKEKIKELLSELPFLTPQKSDFEREFKISYFMDPAPKHLAQIHELLDKNRCLHNLIYSHGAYLDVLPQRASKGKALRYVSYKWGIPLENFLVCGDSGNDEEMLRGEPKGVVVGNYSPELEKIKGKPSIYFSNEKYAAGIVDGIRHYQFLEV